jgi:hypothetical protein
MRKERRQESNIYKESQVILTYNWEQGLSYDEKQEFMVIQICLTK